MTFYEKIRQLMDDENISVRQFSKDTGIATTTLYGWGKGNTPNLATTMKLANYFNVPVEELQNIKDDAKLKEVSDAFRDNFYILCQNTHINKSAVFSVGKFSWSTFNEWLYGNKVISQSKINALCDIFDVSEEDVLDMNKKIELPITENKEEISVPEIDTLDKELLGLLKTMTQKQKHLLLIQAYDLIEKE